MLMMSSEQFPLVAGRNQIKWSLLLCFFCLEKRQQTLKSFQTLHWMLNQKLTNHWGLHLEAWTGCCRENFLQCWEIQRPVLVQLLPSTRSQMLVGLRQTLLCSDHHHKPRTVAELKRKKQEVEQVELLLERLQIQQTH